jgi:hypothetical protein
MKRVGNIASNRIYNPKNTKPPIPFDVDEADSAMERFIRAKYQERVVAARHDTGSSNSDDHPPPLPPKTGSKFGFRSASSIFPLSSKARREPPPPVDIPRRRSPSPQRNNRESKFLGTSGGSGPLDLAGKMTRLRDMGFMDDKRNLAVLNGLGGNIEKTIDTLVRLGEGNGNLAGDSASSRGSRTPITPKFPLSPGLAVNRSRDKPTPEPKSTNPFDMLDVPPAPAPAQPQSSQSTGSKAHPLSQPAANNPFLQASQTTQTPSSNPFGLTPSQSQYSLNQAFQNMAVSTSQPPLFPNHTGGFPGPQQPQHQQLYQQSMTPPVPSIPQQYYPSVVYENQSQPLQQNTSYNPFMQLQTQQAPTINTNFHSNPYTQQQQMPQNLYQSPVEQSTQQQFPSSVYDNGVQQQQLQQQPQQQLNPFFAQNNAQQQQQIPQQSYDFQAQQPQFQQHAREQTYPVMPQQTAKADKRSILDLYNYPQLAPSRPQQQENQPLQEQPQNPSLSVPIPSAPQLQQRSVSSPLATQMVGSRNPFNTGIVGSSPGGDTLGNMGKFASVQNGTRHVSQESMSIDAGGWQNGRHSPDAWGTISARSMR